ncbi:MAG: ABC transporter ATP-binding protein [Gemmatimonadaceae bacterium]
MSVTPDDERTGRAFDRRLARRLLAAARPYRGLTIGAVCVLLVAGTLQLVPPMLTRWVIDVAVPAGEAGTLRTAVLLLVGALLLQVVCAYLQAVLTSELGQRVMHDLRRECFAHLQRLPIRFFDTTPVGRVVTRVTSDVESLNELFTSGVVAGLGDLFTLAAITVLMVVVDWRLALAAYLVVPGILWVSAVFRRRVRNAYREIRGKLARINAFLQERLTAMRVVQLFGRESDETARFVALDREHLDAHLRSVTVYALYFPAIELLTTVALASLVVAAAPRVGAGALTVGTVAAFLQLARRFYQPLQDLSDKYNTLQQAMASAERIFGLLDTPPAPDAEPRVTSTNGVDAVGGPSATGPSPDGDRGRGVTVTFEDVWFSYAEPVTPSSWVLHGVSFTVRPGETLALVGHTGAGKSTIVSLLLRFYDPQRGRILVDGIDIRTLPVQRLRRIVGYVQQDIFLFAGDVASNIRLAAPLDDAAVREAASRVGAHRVVARLSDGYAHQLGERGASLSVGERQLLSFARAIAADPALLVLDEATSAVDSEVEAVIQQGLATLMRGRTTIAVAHRLSTIIGATEILVLHHGEVRERGTHRALLAAGGLYARLSRLQAGDPEAESQAERLPSPPAFR